MRDDMIMREATNSSDCLFVTVTALDEREGNLDVPKRLKD
jgi:hypothetical protein